MGQWVIQGKEKDSTPIVGAEYEIRHSRKGTFCGKIISVNDPFADVEITDGIAKAIMSYNVCEVGEIVSIRDTLSYLILLPPIPETVAK